MVGASRGQYDLRKERIYRVFYLLGGIGLMVLGVILIVRFSGKRDIPGVILGIVALFWAAVLFNQFRVTREVIRELQGKIDEAGVQQIEDDQPQDARPEDDRPENDRGDEQPFGSGGDTGEP
jgi:hypothetical protein